MSEAVLVINSGSSSIKFALFPLSGTAGAGGVARSPVLHGQIEGIGAAPHMKARDAQGTVLSDAPLALATTDPDKQHRETLAFLLSWLEERGTSWRIAAVGHRVVHGGENFAEPVRLDRQQVDALVRLIPLAPLHQPHNLGAIDAFSELAPETPQVACFDTAFHRTKRAEARNYPLPRAVTESGVRRYGFHGLSYEYIARALPEFLGEKAEGRVIVAHLGNGSSMCAMRERRCVETTMGFTALEGLMMGTRPGTLDPGVLLHLMQFGGMDLTRLTRLLYKESGLLGVSGISQDMRTLLLSTAPEAKEAVDLFCYRITKEVGALAAALGGVDALIFTGGIGEHAAQIREKVCLDAAWLGLELDAGANAGLSGAGRISREASRIEAWVIPTNEEWIIADHTAALLTC
ncbi:MAG: acetate/propionate family kinase [Rhodocyclaceae bacterium]|nr:acetate/propionate family kinase [Rhodocyclaceae bacterium]